MDDFEDSELQINFNVTLERLACSFSMFSGCCLFINAHLVSACLVVSIDVENTHGVHKLNLTENIRKWKVKTKGAVQRRMGEVELEEHRLQVESISRGLPKMVGFVDVLQLTPRIFEAFVQEHQVVMVQFYAPWCKWSQQLKPIWTKFAYQIKQNMEKKQAAELQTVSVEHPRQVEPVGIGKVDCTNEEQAPLCQMNHVNRYPTIISFTGGHSHTHQIYQGDRTAEKLVEFTDTLLKNEEDSEKSHESRSEAEKAIYAEEHLDFLYGDGSHSPAVEGCQIAGFVVVSKTPGALIFSATAMKHSIDHPRVNLSHIVEHLSFGEFLAEEKLDKFPEDVTTNYNQIGARHGRPGREYISPNVNQSHEHFIKVVGTMYRYLDTEELSTYKYTCHSITYFLNAQFPEVKFRFDITPINVIITETVSPCYLAVDTVGNCLCCSTCLSTSLLRPCSRSSVVCLPCSVCWTVFCTTRSPYWRKS